MVTDGGNEIGHILRRRNVPKCDADAPRPKITKLQSSITLQRARSWSCTHTEHSTIYGVRDMLQSTIQWHRIRYQGSSGALRVITCQNMSRLFYGAWDSPPIRNHAQPCSEHDKSASASASAADLAHFISSKSQFGTAGNLSHPLKYSLLSPDGLA